MAAINKAEIKLNQNIWALVVSYSALGAAEYWEMHGLRCLALIMARFMFSPTSEISQSALEMLGTFWKVSHRTKIGAGLSNPQVETLFAHE